MKKIAIDQDQLKIIGTGLAIGVSLIAIIAIGSSMRSDIENATYYDSISETNVHIQNTGGLLENSITFIGMDKIVNSISIPDNINSESIKVINEILTYSYPKAKSLSYKNNTAKQEENTYSFAAQLDTGEGFKIYITNNQDGTFSLKIDDKNNTVFNYKSRQYQKPFKSPQALANNILPKTLRLQNGRQFSLTSDKNNKFFLNIDACGDETIIEEAKNIANSWLIDNSYSPEQVNYTVLNKCDRGYN
ncbi:MAG: hypothetical protein MJ154_02820 [Candidatus Saccharibacteria bacterium]|nr:hypothetical protein [Candidatus Saccharibacteria bacterium]